jgi:aerobic carbon-monoxide dehydrogenase medium subunit
VLAGGQSLVPIVAFRLARPAHLIDINAIAGLDGLAVRHDKLCIGARVRTVISIVPSAKARSGQC